MSTLTMNESLEIARERQLDWLLDEALGDCRTKESVARHGSARQPRSSWIAAAVAILAIGTAIAIAVVHEPKPHLAIAPTQDPVELIDWYECHGVDNLDSVPADTRNLKCFNFDDAGIAKLATFEQLERLDLSGNDPTNRGITKPLTPTDAGVAQLAKFSTLRWISLAGCSQITGSSLAELRAIPQLEHLDLASTMVNSEALATLPQLPSLRELSLSFCSEFHGRSLEDIAKIPGLRRLNLSYCYTVSAADAMHLAKLHELRHLDLSICAGMFLGQTSFAFDDVTNEQEPAPPKQDGIGITDSVIEALSSLPLESLNLSQCTSLTTAIGPSLAKMRKLHTLHIRDLPKTDASLLAALPTGLRTLSIDDNRSYAAAGIRQLSHLPHLTELGLNGLSELDDDTLAAVLRGKQLQALRIGGARETRRMGNWPPIRPKLTQACIASLASQQSLEQLDLAFSNWFDEETAGLLGQLPRLQELGLEGATVTPAACRRLASSRSLNSISFYLCRKLPLECVVALQGCKLRELNLNATDLKMASILPFTKQWSGCAIKAIGPDGVGITHRVP